MNSDIQKLKLILPSIKYKQSFVKNFLNRKKTDLENESWEKFKDLGEIKNNFKNFVRYIRLQSKGKNLPVNYVPQTTYWLLKGNQILGTVSIRHKLTESLKKFGGHIGYEISPKFRKKGYGKQILKLALKKARLLGIKKAMITCDVTNIASKKIIEYNKGVVFGKEYFRKNESFKLKYWIDT